MQFVRVSNESEVRIFELSRGKANALNLPMIEELIEAVREGQAERSARAFVFSSAQPGFFCGGFDVAEVFEYDRSTMRHFFGRFMSLYEQLLLTGKPVIGALRGHAYAGGAFLALAFDVRVMAEGEYGFALNEINFGAILPWALRWGLIKTVGGREATRMILTGEAVKPVRALEIGLSDEVVPEDQVLSAALKHAHNLAQKPADAFAFSKHALQRDLGYSEESRHESLDEFLTQWFSPECSERRRSLTASLKTKSSAVG